MRLSWQLWTFFPLLHALALSYHVRFAFCRFLLSFSGSCCCCCSFTHIKYLIWKFVSEFWQLKQIVHHRAATAAATKNRNTCPTLHTTKSEMDFIIFRFALSVCFFLHFDCDLVTPFGGWVRYMCTYTLLIVRYTKQCAHTHSPPLSLSCSI